VADPDTERELAALLPLINPRVRGRVRAELTPTGSRRASEGRRKKFLHSLYHVPPFDYRYVTVLPPERQGPGSVRTELVARGASDECYVIANDSDYDRTTMRLHDALDELVRSEGIILICIPGRLAYYAGEGSVEGDYQWIVERRT
jgi:hypothetical protein